MYNLGHYTSDLVVPSFIEHKAGPRASSHSQAYGHGPCLVSGGLHMSAWMVWQFTPSWKWHNTDACLGASAGAACGAASGASAGSGAGSGAGLVAKNIIPAPTIAPPTKLAPIAYLLLVWSFMFMFSIFNGKPLCVLYLE